MTYEETLDYIHSQKRFNGAPTLARMRELTARLGNPQEKLKIVHVAGTNGKGSTCAMLAGILRAAGYRTGLYLSPFILDFRERIQLDGEMIPRETLSALMGEIRPLAEEIGGITEFELITAVAFLFFARQNCDIAVVEVGLGGRFDATNVITKPLLSIITRIGLDHTAILGETIEQIAFEKCGIIKPDTRVITCAGQETEAFAVILEQTCKVGGDCVVQPSINAAKEVYTALSGTDFTYEGLRLHIPLAGAHQIENALTALTAAKELKTHGGFERITDSTVTEGLASVRFPARLETMEQNPLVLIDGAHNPQGAAALAKALSTLTDGRKLTGVIGVLADKDGTGVLEAVAPCLRRVICVTPRNPRALDAHELAARADALGLQASAAHSVEEALELARAVAAAEKGGVVVCGSLYLAAQAREILGKSQNQ